MTKRTKHTKHPKCETSQYVNHIAITIIVLLLVLAALTLWPGKAGACDYDCGGHDHEGRTVVLKDNSRQAAVGVVVGAVVVCAILSAARGQWCWEDERKPEPLPDPGPAVKDVTPDNLNDRTRTFTVRPAQ